MSELVKINWVAVVSGFLWISGLAMGIVGFSLMEYLRGKKDEPKKRGFCAGIFLFGAVLVIAGGLLNIYKMPTGNLLVSKITKINEAKCLQVGNHTRFQVSDMNLDPLNRKHKRNRTDIRNNTACLFYGGYIKTPPLMFDPGYYVIAFDARGSEALGEFSILKVEFEIPDDHKYLIAKKSEYLRLTKKMKPRAVVVNVKKKTVGRVKISFVNDDFVLEGKKDRNAWIKDVTIKKSSL